MNWKLFGWTCLAILIGLIVGKQLSVYVIAPTGIKIASGNPVSLGRTT